MRVSTIAAFICSVALSASAGPAWSAAGGHAAAAGAPCTDGSRVRVFLEATGDHSSRVSGRIGHADVGEEWRVRLVLTHGPRRTPTGQDLTFPARADDEGVVRFSARLTWDSRTRISVRASSAVDGQRCSLGLTAAAR